MFIEKKYLFYSTYGLFMRYPLSSYAPDLPLYFFYLMLIWYVPNCYAPYTIDDLPWITAHDSEQIAYAAPFLPENPIILEAGVGDGEDSCRMKKKWPNATIYGFEPHPMLFSIAQKNTAHLQGVTLYPYALGDTHSTKTFYTSAKIPLASSLLQDNLDYIDIPSDIGHNGVNYQDTPITVSCTTIDQWAHEMNITAVDYIWLDTEGYELPILMHAQTILPKVRALSLEVNFKEFRLGMTQFSELYEFLTQQGFVLQYIWGRADWQGVALFVNSRYSTQ
jgi:FkbM family methyltransferase